MPRWPHPTRVQLLPLVVRWQPFHPEARDRLLLILNLRLLLRNSKKRKTSGSRATISSHALSYPYHGHLPCIRHHLPQRLPGFHLPLINMPFYLYPQIHRHHNQQQAQQTLHFLRILLLHHHTMSNLSLSRIVSNGSSLFTIKADMCQN